MVGKRLTQREIASSQENVLTDREIEYLSLIGLGFKNKEIGQILCVSLSTVKKTLEKIFLKIHAKDRANAITIAFIHHIINSRMLDDILHKYSLHN